MSGPRPAASSLAGHGLDVLQQLSEPVLGALVVLQTGLESLVLKQRKVTRRQVSAECRQ